MTTAAEKTYELTFDIHRNDWLPQNQRLHWASKAKRTHNLKWAAYTAVANRLIFFDLKPLETCKITAVIRTLTAGRFDAENAAPTVKALIDGLVSAGLLPDDNSKHVRSTTYQHVGRTTRPCHYQVTLLLEEATS